MKNDLARATQRARHILKFLFVDTSPLNDVSASAPSRNFSITLATVQSESYLVLDYRFKDCFLESRCILIDQDQLVIRKLHRHA
jgi:hypothetical protein